MSLLVCREEDGAIAGVYNIGQIFYGPFCSAYLGYYAFAPFAGRGYMREGLQLVLRHAFGPLGLHRSGGQHPARERAVHRAGVRRGLPSGRALASLPQDRRAVA